jgi:competence protein ComEC
VAPDDGRLRVTFLDVGQGDAILVEVPHGPRLLVDGGPGGGARFDVGERVVAPFLWNRGIGRLDVIAATHADADHSGGLAAVLRGLRVGEVWENGRWGVGHEDTVAALERSGAARRVLAAGQRLRLGEATVTVLSPPGVDDAAAPLAGENDHSLVLRLDWRGIALLLTGDLTARGESGSSSAARRSPPRCSRWAITAAAAPRGPPSWERASRASRWCRSAHGIHFVIPRPRCWIAWPSRARVCIGPIATAR